MPGLACFPLSWVSTQQRRAFPICVAQVVRSDAEKAARKAKAEANKPSSSPPQRRPGRPKGSKNPAKAAVTLTPELSRLTGLLGPLLRMVAGVVSLPSVVLDGHGGTHNALAMAQQPKLPLISTLRCDAALSFPSAGPLDVHFVSPAPVPPWERRAPARLQKPR